MFDRYNVVICCHSENDCIQICDTYFKSIDQVIKFIDRFSECCSFYVTDEAFPERDIDIYDLMKRWRSSDE